MSPGNKIQSISFASDVVTDISLLLASPFFENRSLDQTEGEAGEVAARATMLLPTPSPLQSTNTGITGPPNTPRITTVGTDWGSPNNLASLPAVEKEVCIPVAEEAGNLDDGQAAAGRPTFCHGAVRPSDVRQADMRVAVQQGQQKSPGDDASEGTYDCIVNWVY
jgi:hypothetical protein